MRSDGNHGEHEGSSRPVISGKLLLFFNGREYRPPINRTDITFEFLTPTTERRAEEIGWAASTAEAEGVRKPARQPPPTPQPPVVHMRRSDPDGM